MHSSQVIAVLALAGSVLALPTPQDWDTVNYDYSNVDWKDVNYGTPAAAAAVTTPTPTPAPAPVPTPAVVPTPVTSSAPKPKKSKPAKKPKKSKPAKTSDTPVYTPAPIATPAPEPEVPVVTVTPTPTPEPEVPVVTPTPTPTPTPAASTGGYMDIVNEYMTKLSLRTLECDPKLEANALDTVKSSNGEMVHKLNDGSFGQVLAPGSPSDFKHVFVGGWLCERPNLLDGECTSESEGWTYSSTGHADILTNQDYKTIGCADFNGIWSCDVGY